jgi:hypothetical protein
MFDLDYLDGKSLALILWGINKEGKSDIQICHGTARKKGPQIYFERPAKLSGFYLDHHLVCQIRLSDGSLGALMKGAQFVLSLSVGALAEDENDIEFVVRPAKRA